MEKKELDKCLEEHLSKMTITQELHESLQQIPQKQTARISRIKPTVLFAALLCLLSATAIAAAILTLYQSVKEPADQMANVLSHDSWSLEDKEQLIDMMIHTGYAIDNDKLSSVKDTSLDAAEREAAADHILITAYGEQVLDPSILQQSDSLKPDMETVFRNLCVHINPYATDAEIEEAYQSWVEDYYAEDVKASAIADERERIPLSEDGALAEAKAYLYHVLNFSRTEVDAANVTVIRMEKGWKAHCSIDSGLLREALKREWTYSASQPENGIWQWEIYLADNGDFIFQDGYYAYILDQIIPAEAYPGYDIYKNKARAFLQASTEEKAEFSKKWKPVIDHYLLEHPDFVEYFSSTSDICTEYIVTRHLYGIPSEDCITESTAIEAAKDAYLRSGLEGVTNEMLEERCDCFTLLDFTDPTMPLWKVSIGFNRYEEASLYPDDHKQGYFVVIDAITGEVVRQYVQGGPTGKSQECTNADLYAEWFW